MRKADARSANLGEVFIRCQMYTQHENGAFGRPFELTTFLDAGEIVIPVGRWVDVDKSAPDLMFVTSVTSGKSGWVPSILVKKL